MIGDENIVWMSKKDTESVRNKVTSLDMFDSSTVVPSL